VKQLPTYRLQKYLARCGVCSRREGERIIAAGRVKVNGGVEFNPATRVEPGSDVVEVDGKRIEVLSFIYVVLNKPAGCVTTREDPEGRPTVYSLLPPEHHHLNYVGRLDFNTEGVLIFTNDGGLNYGLTRPEFRVEKVYRAKVRGRIDQRTLRRLTAGVTDQDELLTAADAHTVRQLPKGAIVEITLTEGKNREVRRMLEAVGLQVVKLARIRFAGISTGSLKPGQFRELTALEVRALRAMPEPDR